MNRAILLKEKIRLQAEVDKLRQEHDALKHHRQLNPREYVYQDR